MKKENTLIKKAYASIAIANKEPNRDDFETSTLEMPKPERLTDFEMGYEYVSKKVQWSANVFLMNYQNQLVNTGKINDVGAYARVNVGQSYRAGIELQGAYSIHKKVQFFANLSLSRNKIKALTEYIDDYDMGNQRFVQQANTDISMSPNVVAAAGLHTLVFQRAKAHLDFDFVTKYVGKQYLDNTSNENRTIDAFVVSDIKSTYTWHTKSIPAIKLQAALNNVFNTEYAPSGYNFNYYYGGQLSSTNVYYPQARRMILFSLIVELK
jgi:iron complex outermembrane receptor protein